MLDDFVEAKRGGICGIMGDRYINNGNGNSNSDSNNNSNKNSNNKSKNKSNNNSNDNSSTNSNSNRLIKYIDANNLYGYAVMQKLSYKVFKYSDKSLDTILNTPDYSDHGYYLVCDIIYTNSCKEITEQLAPMPNKKS